MGPTLWATSAAATALQSGPCSANKDGPAHLLDFEFIPAVMCTYTEAAGLYTTGMLIMAAVAGAIYIRTGSMILPFGLVMLSGGAVLTVVAPPAVGIAGILVLLAGSGTIAYLWYQYS